jgi:Fic family protein
MARLIDSLWDGSPDAHGPRRARRPCRYQAYIPDDLAEANLELNGDLAADLVDAQVELASFDARATVSGDLEQLARFLLRAEAVASSKIEGLTIGSRRLARHEAKIAHGEPSRDETADSVLGNIEAMRMAVDDIAKDPEVNADHVRALHRALMDRSPTPELGGVVRTTQNWLGGNNFNPCGSDFVPPPPEFVGPLLDDLCDFINRDDMPAVAQAGLVHAQFETIHPFADGNGRTGRALIHVVLRRRNAATSFVPPISLALATNSSGYIGGLTAFRYVGEPGTKTAGEAVSRWLEVFITATRRAVADAGQLGEDLAALELQWKAAVTSRRGSTAERALTLLLTHPVVTVDDLASLTGVSFQAANTAVTRLVDAGVLTSTGSAARNRLFEARDVFTLLTKYERSLATLSGDTRAEQPARSVPARLI